MAEVKALLYTRFETSYREMQSLLRERDNAAVLWLSARKENAFPLKDADAMLADLQKRMQEDFPVFPSTKVSSLFGSSAALPGAAVKTVSPALEDYCAPAFYLTPPLDDTENNVIYINEKVRRRGWSFTPPLPTKATRDTFTNPSTAPVTDSRRIPLRCADSFGTAVIRRAGRSMWK